MIKEFQGEYRWLSNFWPVQILYKERVFHNVENAYHSEKNNNPEWKDFCAQEEDPRVVKLKSLEVSLCEDWEEIRVDVMKELLDIKFSQEPFTTQLLETGDEYLQEGNDWGDVFWGIDLETGEGKNILGEMIMRVRDELRTQG